MSNLSSGGLSRVLAYLKTWITGLLNGKSDTSHTHNDYVTKSGGAVMTGNRISRVDNTYELCMDGGRFFGDGATLTLFGKNTPNSGHEGAFWLTAYNTTECTLRGTPDGSLTWGGTAISLNGHTHTKSQITDFPTIPSNTSQLTNDSGYITSSGSCNYANSAGSAPANGGTSTATAYMNQYDTITYGVNRLQYFNSPTSTTSGAANIANPYNDWFYHLLMSHGNGQGYYGDLALCFHSNTLAFRRIVAGGDQGWTYLVKNGRTIVSGYEVYVG